MGDPHHPMTTGKAGTYSGEMIKQLGRVLDTSGCNQVLGYEEAG